ncbi:MAG: C-GCAxxG-C-C family protein [Bacillota bacterium]|nr:C-GCAxxG-C-C family protein [Bacillota bacterium]
MVKKLENDAVFDNFGQGINCCMQVFSAVAEEIGFSEAEAKKIGAGFGGGMGLGGTCGCVTGALMAIGCKYGNFEPGQTEEMELFNGKKKEFLDEFRAQVGDTQCIELLGGLNPAVPEQKAQIVEKGLMKTICAPAVCTTVEILEEIL